jgi:hyperosmotically inducible periplasmic protein
MQIKQLSSLSWALVLLASPVFAGSALAARAQDQSSQDQPSRPSSAAPDNSAQNKEHVKTADNQKDNAGDREITQKIRQSVMADKSLSTYAHNVKIITQHGQVTLKGPVRSEDEKERIQSKAVDIAGTDKVDNQLTVKQ